jgi:mannosyltransferase OCH1-like enzyme
MPTRARGLVRPAGLADNRSVIVNDDNRSVAVAGQVAHSESAAVVPIPRIVHQLWKTEEVPARWRSAVASVQRYHSGWTYRLWTDGAIDAYVRECHADFYPVFAGFNRHIMRIDVFRYILMHDIGGLYCDLDYEFLRPFDYSDASLVLSMERSRSYGDEIDLIANYVFASMPGHPFWRDVLADLRDRPPVTRDYYDVGAATGPLLLTRIFYQNRERYDGVMLLPKPVLSPLRLHGRRERKLYLSTGITYGFHHGWGTWKERTSTTYLRTKLVKWFGLRRLDPGLQRSKEG